MDLNPVRDAHNHVFKKRKLYETKSEENLVKVSEQIEFAVKKLSAIAESEMLHIRKVLCELQATLSEMGPLNQFGISQKDLNIAMNKYGKVLDKFFQTDIAKAQREIDFDIHIINKIIALHFYRLGQFELGDYFVKEAKEKEEDMDDVYEEMDLKTPFDEMYQILERIKLRDLEPSLAWAKAHHEELIKRGSSLEFNLHQLQYVHFLQQNLRSEALEYAKANFSRFSDTHMHKIQRLMCSLLWVGRLEVSPYSDLSNSRSWDIIGLEFMRECCNLNGYSYESSLQVTISAGAQALPTLLKMVSVLSSKRQEWLALKQLPVEVKLDKEYQFHSIFACPVSKEQSNSENPPMLMPCGHVLCKQSLQKLSKNRAFKCPYCPTELIISQCKPIIF